MRNFFIKIISSINRFMYGRYKGDELNTFLLIIYFFVWILSVILNFYLLQILNIFIMIWFFYRAFSKNIYARQKELTKYFNIKNKIKSFIAFKKEKYQNRKTHLYFKCKKCNANSSWKHSRAQLGVWSFASLCHWVKREP